MTSAGTPGVGQAIADYVRAGLSVLPVGTNKAPNFKILPKDGTTGRATWVPFMRSIPGPATVAAWVQQDPDTGVGVICGTVSGGVVGLDVDDAAFAAWIEGACKRDLLDRTWAVRTGSGKLHVYVKSKKPVTSTVLKAADGTKLADVRADGRPPNGPEYLVAPPSLHPATGLPYTTLTGGPDAIATVTDALHLFTVLASRYATALHSVASAPAAGDRSISDPMDAATAEKLANRLKAFDRRDLPAQVLETIQSGAEPGEGFWKKATSYSDIDFGIVKHLRRLGFSKQEVRDIFATWGVGAACYRNPKRRGSYGNGYLVRAIIGADGELQKEREAQAQAAGENFTILKSTRFLSDPPYFELTLRVHAVNADVDCTLQWDEIQSERGFKAAVGRQCADFWPRFKSVHSGSQKSYEMFLDLLIQMSAREAVPDEATTQGYLREQICRALLSYRISKTVPTTRDEYSIGFRDDARGLIFFKGTRLLVEVAQGMQQKAIPRPDQVWYLLKNMGATETYVKYGQERERLWAVPARAVERR